MGASFQKHCNVRIDILTDMEIEISYLKYKILLCMAKREDWTSFGISGSGKSRKNSLSNVATSCTPVSIERVICPPRSNSSLN